jgi:hypothetical protein
VVVARQVSRQGARQTGGAGRQVRHKGDRDT